MFAVAALLLAACGGAPQAAVPGASPPAVPQDAVPQTVLGLRAAAEDVTKQFAEARDRAFVTDVRLWSLREGERLRATVQVARFAPDAQPEDRDFQRAMIAQLGGSAPRARMVGGQLVYVASGNQQTLFVWFQPMHFVLLGVAADYTRPRALLRALIETVRV